MHGNFAGLDRLPMKKILMVDGILSDLGVSNPQINDPEQGYSYIHPGFITKDIKDNHLAGMIRNTTDPLCF